jgi:hypothetical protein
MTALGGFPWRCFDTCETQADCMMDGCIKLKDNGRLASGYLYVRGEEAMKKRIPISAAARIAKTYGYDQVIIIARNVGEDPAPHGEHCTTFGVDKENCRVAAMIGDFLKHKVMGWRRGREWLI